MIYEKKVKINNMINNVKDKNILKEIFNAVRDELTSDGTCKYTYNNNGIFFDLNILSDTVLIEIEKILNNNNNNNMIETESESKSIKYNAYSEDGSNTNIINNNNDYKLSNKEKNVMNVIQKQKV